MIPTSLLLASLLAMAGCGESDDDSGKTSACNAPNAVGTAHDTQCMTGQMPSGTGGGIPAAGRYERFDTWSYASPCEVTQVQEVVEITADGRFRVVGGEEQLAGAEAIATFGETSVTLDFVCPTQRTVEYGYESPFGAFKLFDVQSGWIRFYRAL